MTMIDGMATLVVSSPNHPAYYVTEVLGIEPDWSADRGDLRPRGDNGNEPIRRRVYDTSMWVLEVDSNPGTKMAISDDDSKGFATLQVLADRLLGRGAALAKVRMDYEVELTWYGTAGGNQAGFVLPSTLLADLAELGLDLNCTVYGQDYAPERLGVHVNDADPVLSSEAVDQLIADQFTEQKLTEQKLTEQKLTEQRLAD